MRGRESSQALPPGSKSFKPAAKRPRPEVDAKKFPHGESACRPALACCGAQGLARPRCVAFSLLHPCPPSFREGWAVRRFNMQADVTAAARVQRPGQSCSPWGSTPHACSKRCRIPTQHTSGLLPGGPTIPPAWNSFFSSSRSRPLIGRPSGRGPEKGEPYARTQITH